jgi:hypothetical protein
MQIEGLVKVVYNTEGGELIIHTKEDVESLRELAEEYDWEYEEGTFEGAFEDFLENRGVDYSVVDMPEVEVS